MAFAILYSHYILYKTVDYRRIKYSCKIRNLQYNKLNLLFTFLSSQNTKLFDRIHILQINYFLIIFQREALTIEIWTRSTPNKRQYSTTWSHVSKNLLLICHMPSLWLVRWSFGTSVRHTTWRSLFHVYFTGLAQIPLC